MTGEIRIFGIDPGLRTTGWGVVGSHGSRLRYIASGSVRVPTTRPLAERLCLLAETLADLLARHTPDEAAVEETFVNADPRSALKLGQARGICLAAPASRRLPVAEYAPNTIKKAVVGAGHAQKEQVTAMVCRLLALRDAPGADEADALAIAICHATHRQFRQRASA